MIRKPLIISTLFLASCFSGPEFVPSKRVDSPMVMSLKKDIEPGSRDKNYGWLFWYIPVASIVMMWSYREFIKKKQVRDEI